MVVKGWFDSLRQLVGQAPSNVLPVDLQSRGSLVGQEALSCDVETSELHTQVYMLESSTLDVYGSVTFEANTADEGGAVSLPFEISFQSAGGGVQMVFVLWFDLLRQLTKPRRHT